MQTQMSYNFNHDVIKHIQGLSLSYINKQDNTYLNQRINSDASSLVGFCITILQSVLVNIVTLIVPFVILLTMNWFVAVLLAGFLIIYAILYFVFRKPLYNAGLVYRETQGKFFSKLFEQLKYIKLIKINSIQSEMSKRTDGSFVEMKGAAIKNQKVSYVYSGLDGFISTLAQISLFVVGGLMVLSGDFTIGMFTIFTSYFNMILGSSRYFFGLGASYQHTLVSYDRIKEILDERIEGCGTEVINSIYEIELHNVVFSYAINDSKDFRCSDSTNGRLKGKAEDKETEPRNYNKTTFEPYSNNRTDIEQCNDKTNTKSYNSKKVIDGFNAKFTKGKIYAISGANGTGKSTLINLIMGLYIDEYSGNITYNGIDIRNIDMVNARRSLIGFAEQEPTLIKDSMLFNLRFGCESGFDSADQSLSNHIQTLGMQDFISKNGLDFPLNEDNTNTSGGEKQKVSILKVLHKDPAIMIFDEPTSALDVDTTKRLVEYLQQIKQDKIIIVITHDEVVKGLCDELVGL